MRTSIEIVAVVREIGMPDGEEMRHWNAEEMGDGVSEDGGAMHATIIDAEETGMGADGDGDGEADADAVAVLAPSVTKRTSLQSFFFSHQPAPCLVPKSENSFVCDKY
jgi:hypothetical protein